jgi:hypothetical protein
MFSTQCPQFRLISVESAAAAAAAVMLLLLLDVMAAEPNGFTAAAITKHCLLTCTDSVRRQVVPATVLPSSFLLVCRSVWPSESVRHGSIYVSRTGRRGPGVVGQALEAREISAMQACRHCLPVSAWSVVRLDRIGSPPHACSLRGTAWPDGRVWVELLRRELT